MSPPHAEPAITRIASLLSHASRSMMLLHLLGGRKASASDLAAVAGISPATASEHLMQLLDGGLVCVMPRGRHRYYALADESVARLIESLADVSERPGASPAWRHPARARLKFARCCYGHLAGELGVRLFGALVRQGAFEPAPDGLRLTGAGERALQDLGMAPVQGPGGRRRFAYACHDWSEGLDHLAGALGDRLLQHLLDQGWLRRSGERALELTPRGHTQLLPVLDALDAQRP